jgi:hypothetical protein
MKRTVVLLAIVFCLGFVLGETYYVNADSRGFGGDGSFGNPFSVEKFNSLSGTGYAGDTFYFSGTFINQIKPRISGTAEGGHVVLDGFEAGDSWSPVEDGENPGAALFDFPCAEQIGTWWCESYDYIAIMIDEPLNYLTIQDFRFKNSRAGISIYKHGASGFQFSDIIIRRNYFAKTSTSGLSINQAERVVVGGERGDGNYFVDCGYTHSYSERDPWFFNVQMARDVVISHNEIHSTSRYYPGNGIEMNCVQNSLVEYNYIHDMPLEGWGEACIAIKEASCNNEDIIVRYNKFENALSRSQGYPVYIANPWTDDGNNHIYIYGNEISGGGVAGITLYYVHDIYLWSNIIHGNFGPGIYIPSGVDGDMDVFNINVYNNLIANNGENECQGGGDCWLDNARQSSGMSIIYGSSGFEVKNNIFYNNRPSKYDYPSDVYHQIHFNGDKDYITELEHNHYYHEDKGVVPVYNERRVGEMSIEYLQNNEGKEDDYPAGEAGNPGLNNDFTIADGSSAVIGKAKKMTQEVIPYSERVVVDGESYCSSGCDNYIGYNLALHPDTDWAQFPSEDSIRVVSQDDFGDDWERGAYVYAEGGSEPIEECVDFNDIVDVVEDWKSGVGSVGDVLGVVSEWMEC